MKKALIIIATLLGIFFPAIICLAQQTDPAAESYIVKKGDCLWKIALRVRVDIKILYRENRRVIGKNPNLIHSGMRLMIPRQGITQKQVKSVGIAPEKKSEQAKPNMFLEKTKPTGIYESAVEQSRNIGKNDADRQNRKNIPYGILPACAALFCVLVYKKVKWNYQKDSVEVLIPIASGTSKVAQELGKCADDKNDIKEPLKDVDFPQSQIEYLRDDGEGEQGKFFVAYSLDDSDSRYYVFEGNNMMKIGKDEFPTFILNVFGEKFPASMTPNPYDESIFGDVGDIFEKENIRKLNADEWRELILEIHEARLE